MPQKWLIGTIRHCLTGQKNRGTQPLMKGKAFASRVLHPLHFSTNNPRQGPLSKPRAVEAVEIPVSPGATRPVRRFLRGFGSHPRKLEKIANVTQDPISDRTPVCKRLPEHPRNEDPTKTGLQNLPGDHRAVRTLARIRPSSRFFGRSILSSAPSRDVLSPAPAFVPAGSGPRRTAFL